ncbi:WD40-repeat-containing domain protein [Ilyonectria robusta]|uniref:WD40-repeat-containing domain protein n=1 Tax=Ilyonectria robusta TaxID=1079257 RepID=UPI001E8E5ADE|nr:WD40-repeat-containing domain protein [Ilyonectria robusta]KAH8688172.1 WD40-repeat-containing domain protein [Ilyonectria robusta]
MADSAPSPKAILRGHKAQVHSATFIRGNSRLVTGDAEGYVVVWDLTIMRPRAVWRAHESAILGVQGWGNDKIISHGRDHKLIVWKLSLDDEENLSKTLPVEDVPTPRTQPWILHLLEVNTMNFCSFAASSSSPGHMDDSSEILIAVPNTLASEAIDIYSLPSQTRIHTIRPGEKNGMAMCLSLFHLQDAVTLVAAFENGYASVHRLNADGEWITTYRSQAHSQPILSLDVDPGRAFFLSSSADSLIAKHPIPTSRQETITIPQSNARVVEIIDEEPTQPQSLLSSGLKQASSHSGQAAPRVLKEWENPLKVVNTKHSGQQSLKMRSDGRIFATAGWDSKVRVYSAKTMKELAVLKWHQVGCYAVAFSDPTASNDLSSPASSTIQDASRSKLPQQPTSSDTSGMGISLRSAGTLVKSTTSVKDRRIAQAKTTHWVAAGAKDGKVSLWDIY